MAMKVYQGGIDGRNRACVAAPSWKAAQAAVSAIFPNISLYHMRDFWSITGNAVQIDAAMSEPGVPFVSRGNNLRSESYHPVRSFADYRRITQPQGNNNG